MGNYINKFFSHNNELEEEETEIQSPTNEVTVAEDNMYTPVTDQKTLPIDPRSVTSGIDRTPIEVNYTPIGLNKKMISAIPKHLQMKPYLETDIDKVMVCLSAKKHEPKLMETVKLQFPNMQDKNVEIQLTPINHNINSKKKITSIEKERYDILGLDPRSPAADFNRTPILKPKSVARLKARSHEYLHRSGSYDTDSFSSKFSYCEMLSQFNVPEIQALPDLASHAIKSLNLVNVYKDKFNESRSSDSSQGFKSETISESGEQQLESEDEDKASSEHNYKSICVKKDTQDKEVHTNENDIIRVWRDSLVINETKKSDDMQILQEGTSQLSKEEVIITFDDDSVIKDILSQKMLKSQNDKQKIELNGKKKKDLKLEVKTVTDDKRNFNSNDKNCGNECIKVRTPLGNRSNNGQIQMILSNSPQQVFRNKSIMPKTLQENTPPHKKYIIKSKAGGMQWDSDSTVII